MALTPRIVVVTRPTEYELLVGRHGTREQAQFFLSTRGQQIEPLEAASRQLQRARKTVMEAVPRQWRSAHVERGDLDRFLFEPEDIVVALGQDGLVANVAKYLSGQPVVGVDPQPGSNAGVLVPHAPEDLAELLPEVATGAAKTMMRTMVAARLGDGQEIRALNEVFVGHRTHQTARYRIVAGDSKERHFSSGVIVSTGTGATGWARSVRRERAWSPSVPSPEDRWLVFFVREAFPSPVSGTEMTAGTLGDGDALTITSEMDEGGTVFGDGIEDDRIAFTYGMVLDVRRAKEGLRCVVG